MNNHKILWKISIFKWIQILLCVAPLFVQSSGRLLSKRELLDSMGPYVTPLKKISFNVFGNKTHNFESEIFESLQTTKNIFASKGAEFFTNMAAVAASFNPVWTAISGILSTLRALFAHESDWTKSFSKTITNQLDLRDALNKVNDMSMIVQSIREKSVLLTEENPSRSSRRFEASEFHNSMNIMLNHFEKTDSIFKRYPLIGAPLLLTLSQLIAYYEPTVKELDPFRGHNPELSCKVRNILLDYRPRTIVARLEQLLLSSFYVEGVVFNVKKRFAEFLDDTMSYKYVKKNITNIRCEKGCEKLTYLHTLNNLDLSTEEAVPEPPVYRGYCVIDRFSADYYPGNAHYSGNYECIRDYLSLVRDRVEELFYVDYLNKFCENPPEATGFGYLTMNFKHLHAIGGPGDIDCDPATRCDPYIKIFINNETHPLWETDFERNNCCFDVDRYFISQNISKRSRVKIEVWDYDGGDLLGPDDDWIFTREGTIENFLKRGHRDSNWDVQGNFINTVSFWQDIYKEERNKIKKIEKGKDKKPKSEKDKDEKNNDEKDKSERDNGEKDKIKKDKIKKDISKKDKNKKDKNESEKDISKKHKNKKDESEKDSSEKDESTNDNSEKDISKKDNDEKDEVKKDKNEKDASKKDKSKRDKKVRIKKNRGEKDTDEKDKSENGENDKLI